MEVCMGTTEQKGGAGEEAEEAWCRGAGSEMTREQGERSPREAAGQWSVRRFTGLERGAGVEMAGMHAAP